MIVRELKPGDDLGDLIALSREFFEEYQAHDKFFQIDVLRDEDVLDHFVRLLNSDEAAVFVAEEGGRTVGYITVRERQQQTFWRTKRYGTISGLMVGKEYRRKGYGKRLLAAAAEHSRKKGIRYVTLYTATNNDVATAFYTSQGMRPLQVTMIGAVDDMA